MSRWVAASFILLSTAACAVSARGLVRPTDAGPQLIEPTGRTWDLRLPNDRARLLRHLDGEEVQVEGARRGGDLRVDTWSLREGTHGLQVFLGPVGERDGTVFVQDEVSGGPVRVDAATARALSAYREQVVLLEGYVEGAQAVRVVYYRVLADLEAPE